MLGQYLVSISSVYLIQIGEYADQIKSLISRQCNQDIIISGNFSGLPSLSIQLQV